EAEGGGEAREVHVSDGSTRARGGSTKIALVGEGLPKSPRARHPTVMQDSLAALGSESNSGRFSSRTRRSEISVEQAGGEPPAARHVSEHAGPVAERPRFPGMTVTIGAAREIAAGARVGAGGVLAGLDAQGVGPHGSLPRLLLVPELRRRAALRDG